MVKRGTKETKERYENASLEEMTKYRHLIR